MQAHFEKVFDSGLICAEFLKIPGKCADQRLFFLVAQLLQTHLAALGFSLLLKRKPPLFTPYSVYTLHTNGHFSHAKATAEFGYAPRPIEESIRDSF